MDAKTYDVCFNNETDSNNKGFKESFDYCKGYIEGCNGTNESYFEDYKNGVVSIQSHEDGNVVYQELIK
ncbi:MAG: hypothetical protein PF487_08990 [Bacteroidales bacterium]|jgi:hypothetical protein|nr:hypothetical protein [Bacteroidales bacterium]